MKQRLSMWTVAILMAWMLPCIGRAQVPSSQAKTLSLEQVIPGGKKFFTSYYPQDLFTIGWVGEKFVFYNGEDGYRSLLACDAVTGNQESLITVEQLKSIVGNLEEVNSQAPFPTPTVSPTGNYLVVQLEKGVYLIDPVAQKLVRHFPLDKDYLFVELDPTEQFLVVKSHDGELGVIFPQGSANKYFKIAQDEPEAAVVYGEAVHQREFGIEKGIFPSPKGNWIAFYRMDQSMVEPYPLVDSKPHKSEVRPLRYPMAGEVSHHVTVGLYHIPTQKISYLKTGGDPEHYLTNIAWSPNEEMVYVAELNREQNFMELNAYSVEGNCMATLFTEQDEKYVEPLSPMLFVPNSNGKEFLWLSRRNGFYNYYLYRLNKSDASAPAKLVRSLAHGAGEVQEFLGFDKTGKYIYYTGKHDSPLENHLYKQELKSGKVTKLTTASGVHTVYLSKDGSVIDKYSAYNVPNIIALLDPKGKEIKRLITASNPLEQYDVPVIEHGNIMAEDGKTELHYRLVKPLHMESGKKYPVVIYVYGGPHAQMIENRWLWGAGGWDLYMAQQGYAVLTLDNRGSAGRGKEFEQVIHRQLGTVEMADQMKAVDYLRSLPWVDSERLGIHGWSFGGFMTTNLMLSYPDVFKVGVAGGPVMDWSRYEIMYGERYNDNPKDNVDGYRTNNLILRAGQLQGRLLLIHGTEDNVVLWQHAQEFVRACVDAGTYPDCMFYPGHEHNVRGADRVHLYQTITRYFLDFL